MSHVDEATADLTQSLEKTVETLRRNLAGVRTGRAHAGMLNHVRADYYGVPTALNQFASVSVPEPRLIVIKPHETGQIAVIEKAVRDAGLGLTPQVQGNTVQIPVPALTQEQRVEAVKLTRKHGEEAKAAVQKLTEAESAQHQALAQKYNQQIDDVITAKEKDIMQA
ncbi:ribosome recycling factor [Streptomyces sp. Go40/10]|uniref:ribosome-recycling factor n=1 Tax=Streptomyces sp. Go40/10 TaxID=2825844 RepID=UPI001E4A92F2|nr:ribosome-recycling factor [Streptomyces sp. Go40/10]UFQ99891.1 ribosome recycling factor [Streptomyces sp. Go40/10]